MNKKGQTLIAFVLLLPIVLLFLAFVVDTGLLLKEKTKGNSTLRTILKTTYKDYQEENYEEKVKDLLEKNNIPTENTIIKIEETQIHVTNEYEIESIFGSIIGLKTYKIKIGYSASINEEKITITKEPLAKTTTQKVKRYEEIKMAN